VKTSTTAQYRARLQQLGLSARVGLSAATHLVTERKRLGLSPRQLGKALWRLSVIAGGMAENKSVRFGNRIFSEAFTPPWPDRGFFDVMSSQVLDRPFVPYAVFAITAKCMFRCEHCYAIKALKKKEVLSRQDIVDTVESMCTSGVGVISFEGGEPLLRYEDLLAALRTIKGRATPFIATTGWGMTAERAKELADAGLVAAQISLDHYEPEKHNEFRRNPKAFAAATKAAKLLRDAGVLPILAVCATREMIRDDGLHRYFQMARDLGAGLVQVLDPLPAGNFLTSTDSILGPDELETLMEFHRTANTDPKYHDYPGVCARPHLEHESRFGCGMGGLSVMYVDASGNMQPCVYTHLSVGNVREEPFEVLLDRMRGLFPNPVAGLCPAYELAKPTADAIAEGASNPLPLEHTERLAATITSREQPEIYRRMGRRRLPVISAAKSTQPSSQRVGRPPKQRSCAAAGSDTQATAG